MATYDLGKVVGDAGEKGDDGSSVWNTSTAPTYANSKYTFTISNLSGKTGLEIAVNDIIFYSTYYYIVSAVNTSTVDCSTRVSIKGSDASVTIVDNLTSTSSTSALSAKQGKVLNDNKIETSSIATSFGSTPSDSKVASEKLVKNSLDGKAPTSHASSSSTYGLGTTANYGHVKTINGLTQSSHSDGTALSAYQGYLLNNAISGKADNSDIPTKTSDLTNDGADGTNVFVANNDSRLSDARTPTSHTHGNLTNDGKVGSTANYFVYTTTSGAITSKQKIGNITTSGAIGSTSGKPIITTTSGVLTVGSFGTSSGTFAEGNHTHSGYQATLVSGTNIKTINNNSLLGSGNIDIQGSSVDIVTSWESTPSDSKVASEKLVKDTLDTKLGTTLTPSTMNFNNGNKPLVVEYNTNAIKTSIFADTYVAHTGSLANITSTSNPTQAEINSGVNTKIGDLEDLIGDAILYINGSGS